MSKHFKFNNLFFFYSFQVLYLSNNRLFEIPNELFRDLYNLRIVELGNNYLHGLPDMLFKDGALERLDLSGNRLSQVPFASFKVDAAVSLIQLDLSNNRIGALRTPDAFGRFKVIGSSLPLPSIPVPCLYHFIYFIPFLNRIYSGSIFPTTASLALRMGFSLTSRVYIP